MKGQTLNRNRPDVFKYWYQSYSDLEWLILEIEFSCLLGPILRHSPFSFLVLFSFTSFKSRGFLFLFSSISLFALFMPLGLRVVLNCFPRDNFDLFPPLGMSYVLPWAESSFVCLLLTLFLDELLVTLLCDDFSISSFLLTPRLIMASKSSWFETFFDSKNVSRPGR